MRLASACSRSRCAACSACSRRSAVVRRRLVRHERRHGAEPSCDGVLGCAPGHRRAMASASEEPALPSVRCDRGLARPRRRRAPSPSRRRSGDPDRPPSPARSRTRSWAAHPGCAAPAEVEGARARALPLAPRTGWRRVSRRCCGRSAHAPGAPPASDTVRWRRAVPLADRRARRDSVVGEDGAPVPMNQDPVGIQLAREQSLAREGLDRTRQSDDQRNRILRAERAALENSSKARRAARTQDETGPSLIPVDEPCGEHVRMPQRGPLCSGAQSAGHGGHPGTEPSLPCLHPRGTEFGQHLPTQRTGRRAPSASRNSSRR